MDSELEKLHDFSLTIDEYNLSLLQKNTEIVLSIDEFEDVKTIQFAKCGYGLNEYSVFRLNSYFLMYIPEASFGFDFLGFSFVNNNGFSYLDVVIHGSEISLASGDYFVILFDDGTKEKYVFNKPSSGNKSIYSSNYIPLKSEDLFKFLTKNIIKVKVVSSRKSTYAVFCLNNKENKSDQHFNFQYTTIEAGQLLFKYMTYKFIEFNLLHKI